MEKHFQENYKRFTAALLAHVQAKLQAEEGVDAVSDYGHFARYYCWAMAQLKRHFGTFNMPVGYDVFRPYWGRYVARQSKAVGADRPQVNEDAITDEQIGRLLYALIVRGGTRPERCVNEPYVHMGMYEGVCRADAEELGRTCTNLPEWRVIDAGGGAGGSDGGGGGMKRPSVEDMEERLRRLREAVSRPAAAEGLPHFPSAPTAAPVVSREPIALALPRGGRTRRQVRRQVYKTPA